MGSEFTHYECKLKWCKWMWDVGCKFRGKNNDIHRQTPLKLIFLKEKMTSLFSFCFNSWSCSFLIQKFQLPQSLQVNHWISCGAMLPEFGFDFDSRCSKPGKRCVFALCWHVLESE